MEQNQNKLASAFVKAQAEFPQIKMDSTVKVKTKSGVEYSFRYASLPAILSDVKPVLKKNGLAIMQRLDGGNILTSLLHESGESVSSATALPYVDGMTTQERGSVISYFRRYAIQCLLGIVADEDDDGNRADKNSYSKQEASNVPVKPEKPPSKPSASGATQNKQPIKKPTAPPDVDGDLEKIIIEELPKCGFKEGLNKNNKPYIKASFKHGKDWFSTFDKGLQDLMVNLQGDRVEVLFDRNPFGCDIKSISLVQNAPEHGDAFEGDTKVDF
jgi:hypothetical protein